MDSRHTSDNNQRYTDAGEQAARVIGEFISMATEFSRKLDDGINSATKAKYSEPENGGHSAASTEENHAHEHIEEHFNEQMQKAGEYLRELREAAGYTIDGFAKAMNRENASSTVEAAEAGREVFPQEWFDQAVAVLQHRDPLEFFDKLRKCYEPASEEPSACSDKVSGVTDKITARREKLHALFANNQDLADLTDSQFEELASFMQANFDAALQLVSKKKG